MTGRCSNCGLDGFIIKKHMLCNRCYQSFRKNGKFSEKHKDINNLYSANIDLSAPVSFKNQSKSEILFAQNHPNFLYQPTIFALNGKKYTPDFYDPEDNIFYEIIGSRQRFFQLKDKFQAMSKIYPRIELKIVCGNGEPYNHIKGQISRRD